MGRGVSEAIKNGEAPEESERELAETQARLLPHQGPAKVGNH